MSAEASVLAADRSRRNLSGFLFSRGFAGGRGDQLELERAAVNLDSRAGLLGEGVYIALRFSVEPLAHAPHIVNRGWLARIGLGLRHGGIL